MRSVRSGVLLLAFIAAVAGCANGHSAPRPAASPHTTASAAPVSVRVVLPSRTMTAGSQMTGRVVVDNNTGHAIHEHGCLSLFQVALTSSTYHPKVAWAACLQLLTIPAGTSSYPVKIVATYFACGQGNSRDGLKACLPDQKLPPLPPGHYNAKLFIQVKHLAPAPPAIPVRVTAQ